MQMSFGSLELRQRLRQDSVLMKIDALIDWEGYVRSLGDTSANYRMDVAATLAKRCSNSIQ